MSKPTGKPDPSEDELLCSMQQLKSMVDMLTVSNTDGFRELDRGVQNHYFYALQQKAGECVEMAWRLCCPNQPKTTEAANV